MKNITRCGLAGRSISMWVVALCVSVVVLGSTSRWARACDFEDAPPRLASSVLTEAVKREARAFQRELRQRFPDHVQGTFQKAVSTGRTALIIAEPPPHATPEAIRRRLGASFTEVVRRAIGYDGWSRDLVAIVDHQDRASLADALARLDAYLFGTSYRAAFLPQDGRRAFELSGLDIAVSPSELRRWVFDADVRFDSVDGAISITGEDFKRRRAQGVFRSSIPGLVVWAVPERADLCQYQGELREFTLESDLVLGGLATAQHVLFVGRERRTNPEAFPPLRSESILALAATQSGSLAQSYQRLALFSGKLRSGKDWAPILLSDELQDTEFGSLLNLTDQMLKGWSLNGQVSYHGFDFYPRPGRWAAPQSIVDRLNSASLTFNWNTSGATAFTQDEESAVISVLRTGALPITYIPEDKADPAVAELEASYHAYFATLGNPDLARVVAYTAMFEVLRSFGLKASCYEQGTGERKGDTLLVARAQSFISAIRKQDASLARSAKSALGPHGPRLLGDAKQFFDDIERTNGASGLRELAHYLASVRGSYGVVNPSRQLLAQAESLAHGEGFTALVRATVDRDEVMERFVEVLRPSEARWLRTPTVVLSQATSTRGTYVEGGHNVDVRPFEVTPDPNTPRRRPRIDTLSGRSRLRVHPDDADLVRALTTVLKKVEDGRVSPAVADVEMASLIDAMPDTSPRDVAQALWPGGETLTWPNRSGAGWAAVASPARGAPASGRVRLERKSGGFEVWLPGHMAPIRAESPISLSEKLNAFVSESGPTPITLEFVGMREDQARALRQTLRLRLREVMAGGKQGPSAFEIHVGDQKGPPRTFESKTSVVRIGLPREVRSDRGTVYECVLEMRDEGLLVHASVTMKARITESIRRGFRRIAEAVLRKRGQSGADAARALRAALKKDYRDPTIDVLVKDGEACNFVIANR